MNNTLPLCSECFQDQGLKLLAERIGIQNSEKCNNCNNANGKKLTTEFIEDIAYRFFVAGSISKFKYGAAPRIQINNHAKTNVQFSNSLKKDVKLFERVLGIGFFNYGPRLWMIGQIEPLINLQNKDMRNAILNRN